MSHGRAARYENAWGSVSGWTWSRPDGGQRLTRPRTSVDRAEVTTPRSIEIVAYQERWIEEFRETAGALRAALGELALRIDHIGSTSVPGLGAKDCVDLQVTVAVLHHGRGRAVGDRGRLAARAVGRVG